MTALFVEGEPDVMDVVLVPGPYQDHDPAISRPIVWFDAPIEIAPSICIGDIGHDLSEAVLDACDPSGENFKPHRQFGAPYGFYRTVLSASVKEGLTFDPDNQLCKCIALSRLIHPTSIGFRYSARIRTWKNGARQIIPHSRGDLSPDAFLTDTPNNFLVPADAPSILALIQAFDAGPLPQRLHSGMWYCETAFRSYYVDLRWPLLTTGLEALIHIDGERFGGRFAGSTKVFVDRLLALGGIEAAFLVPENDLRAMYGHRSGLVHGQTLGTLDPARRALYSRKEQLLRGILRKAILDPAFRALFTTDAAIQEGLPLRP
jgi:hypothetical protein